MKHLFPVYLINQGVKTMSPLTKTKTIAILPASVREGAGKGVARALRREGKVPAVLYSKQDKPMSLAMPLKEVTLEYKRGRFRSRLIDINLDGKTVQALPKEVQFHPVTDIIEHVDFMRVEKGVPIRVQVPVHCIGQEKSVGIKRGGVLNIVRHEIEFTCAPESIPTHIEVNVMDMDIGHSVHINDIKLPTGVVPVIKRNFTVATVAGRSSSMDEAVEVKPVTAEVPSTEVAAVDPAAEGAAAPGADAKKPAEGAKKDEGKKDKK
jgi:large subunit ribosomal protein L25